jgi:hypothetical protein
MVELEQCEIIPLCMGIYTRMPLTYGQWKYYHRLRIYKDR